VLDERGVPTPARIYLTGPDGRAYAPAGVVHRVVTGDYRQPYAGEYYFYTGGTFDVVLPAGEIEIEAVKGLEYAPLRKRVRVDAGKNTTIDLALTRPFNMAARGSYSGDVHIHPNLFAQSWITPQDVLQIAQAEDLNVSNLLVCNDPSGFMNDLSRFEGKPHALSERYIPTERGMRNLEYMATLIFESETLRGALRFVAAFAVPYDYPQTTTRPSREVGVHVRSPRPPSEYPVDISWALPTPSMSCAKGMRKRTPPTGTAFSTAGFAVRCLPELTVS
jgi:hypothetical protein